MVTHATSFTRTLAVTVTAAVTLGLLGCSAGAEPTEVSSAPAAAASTAPAAPTEEAATTEEVAPTETPAPETGNSSLPADFPASVPLVSEKIERTKSHNNDNQHGKGVFKSADYGVVLVAVDTPNHREFMYKVFTK